VGKILNAILVIILIVSLVGCGKVDYSKMTVEEILEKSGKIKSFSEVEGHYNINLQTELVSDKAKYELTMETGKILDRLKDRDIKTINLTWEIELIDQDGNKEYKPVMRITFEDKTWIDAEHHTDLPRLANDYWEHEVLNQD